MKLGIIGAGMIIKEFLPHLIHMKEVQVLAILGRESSLDKTQSLCQQHQISTATASFDEFVASGIDTAYIALPNHLHMDYASRCLKAGLHVIVEKPLTATIQESLALQALAQEHNRMVFEAITTLHLPSYDRIMQWLPQIGRIRLVESRYCQYSSRYDAFQAGTILPAFDPLMAGGAMMDLNLYNLHFVMGLFGRPIRAQYQANIERGIDTSGVALLTYPDFQALCIAAKDCGGKSYSLIQGTKGYIEIQGSANLIQAVTLHLNDGRIESFEEPYANRRVIPEFQTFARMIKSDNTAEANQLLNKSIAVSQVQTLLRLDAGLHFPMDEKGSSTK